MATLCPRFKVDERDTSLSMEENSSKKLEAKASTQPTALEALRSYFKVWSKVDPTLKYFSS